MVKINKIKNDTKLISEILKDDRKFTQFVRLNDRFVYNIASKLTNYKGYNGFEALDDLYQVGVISLHKALQLFSKTRSATFSTFAYQVISNDIKQYIKKEVRKSYPMVSMEVFKSTNGVANANKPEFGDYNETNWNLLYHSQKQLCENFENVVVDRIVLTNYFSKFSKKQQEVMDLIHSGLTLRETAELMDLSPSQVKKIYYRDIPKVSHHINNKVCVESIL